MFNIWASQEALVVKNPPVNAGVIKDTGSIPGWRRSSGEGMATYSSVLVWRIPWTEEPGGAAVHWVTNSRTWLRWLSTHTHIYLLWTKNIPGTTWGWWSKSNKVQFLWEIVCSSKTVLFHFVSLMHNRVLKRSNCPIDICGGPLCSQKSLSLAEQY